MSFWETAAAAFAGQLGLMLVRGFGHRLRHLLWAHSTGIGRYMTEIDRRIDKDAGKLASAMREDRDQGSVTHERPDGLRRERRHSPPPPE